MVARPRTGNHSTYLGKKDSERRGYVEHGRRSSSSVFISQATGRLLESTSAFRDTLRVNGSYRICFHVEKATERLTPDQGCKTLGWRSIPVTEQAPLDVLTSYNPTPTLAGNCGKPLPPPLTLWRRLLRKLNIVRTLKEN